MKKEDFQEAIKKLDEHKRKFKQSYELIINLKGLNLKKPEEQLDIFLKLPHAPKQKVKIAALVGPELQESAQENCDGVILADNFSQYAGDKKKIKALSRSYDYFIAQANIMPLVAKTFGRYFGPHGKMPNPKVGCVVPPNANLKTLVENLQKTVRAAAKVEASVKVKAGHEDMKAEDIAENMQAIHYTVLHKLPQEKNNIKNVLVKKTMSPPIKVEEK